MKTTFLIWENPPNDGVSPNWQEIAGKEFLALVRSSAGESRHFIKLPSIDSASGDGAIVMETNQSDYADWKREKNHTDYLQHMSKTISVISYDAMESEDGECFGEELLPDPTGDIETKYINTLTLEAALASLANEEYRLVEFFYLSDKPGTVRAYEDLTGIAKSTVNRHQKAVLKKLKKFFVD